MTTPTLVDPKLALLAQEYAERADPLPEGRSGSVTRACREATIHLILTGKKKVLDAPAGSVVGSLTEEKS